LGLCVDNLGGDNKWSRSEKQKRGDIGLHGKIGSLENRIAKDYGLPRGSVRLVGVDGKKKRSDASVMSLLAEW